MDEPKRKELEDALKERDTGHELEQRVNDRTAELLFMALGSGRE